MVYLNYHTVKINIVYVQNIIQVSGNIDIYLKIVLALKY